MPAVRRALVTFALGLLTAGSLAACAGGADAVAGPGTGGGGGGQGGVPARLDVSTNAVGLGAVGASETVTALVRDANGGVLSGASVTWTSSDITVADVAGVGTTAVITARAPGRTTVRAQIGAFVQEIQVSVFSIRAITLTPTVATLRAGDRFTLVAAVDGDASASQTLRWSAENPAIASVSDAGQVTGVGLGTTRITVASAADARVSASATVMVIAPRSLTIEPTATSLWVGDRVRLGARVDVDSTQSREVQWSSSAPTVLAVDAQGEVIALAPGTATIRASSVADVRASDSVAIRVFPARAVTVSPNTVTLGGGQVRQLAASVEIEAGLSTDVTWRSENPAVAMVSQGGLVTGVSQGTTTVTAISVADTLRRGRATVTVVPIVRDLDVSPSAVTLFTGDQRQLTGTLSADPGADNTLSWRSSNAAVASVSSTGLVTALSVGTAIVTATSAADTTRTASALVTVRYAPAVFISPVALTLFNGQQQQFTATVQADAGIGTAVSWSVADPTVAMVSNTGYVTALRPGTTQVTATLVADTTRHASATLQVLPVVREVRVTPTSLAVAPGESATLGATVDADAGTNTAVTWRTGNAAVANVSAAGVVTGVANGSTTITAISVADTTKRATASVVVATSAVLGVTVSPASASLAQGNTVQLTPTVSVQGSASRGVTYSSSNPAVASVNFAGLVTAMGTGTANITVSSVADPSRTALAAITVTAPAPPSTRLAVSWSATRLGGALIEDVISLDAIDAATAFAVNNTGDVYRYSGGTWSLSARGSTYGTQFRAVNGPALGSVFAVGTGGVIIRFNGSSWSTVASGTSQTLNDVYIESASAGFAVGDNGVALRWNGASWSGTPSNTTERLHGVWSSGTTAIAVGDNGVVRRFDGTVWSPQSSGTTQQLRGVFGTSTSDLIAVGRAGTIIRSSGGDWTPITGLNSAVDFYAVSGRAIPGSAVTIAADNGVNQLAGTSLSPIATPLAPRMLSVAVDAAGTVWAGGQRGVVLGNAGGPYAVLNAAPDLIDVWMTSATNGWAVGEFGFIYRFTGSAWVRQASPSTITLNTVWADGTSDAFAGGENGTMLRWNGSSWSAQPFPSSSSVYALWGSSATNVYATTAAGEIVRFNGVSWSVVANAGAALWAIHGSDANDIMATGENGVAMRFNGTSWSVASASGTGTLAGVYVGSTGTIAVGSASSGMTGIALRNAGSWSSSSIPVSSVLTSVWGPAESDVYATGDAGVILRWNGTSWASMSSGTSDYLWSLGGAPSGNGGGFAVGYNSTIVSATPGSGGEATAFRASALRTKASLTPAPGTRLVREVLPTGKARRHRKGR